ncbi:MAG: bifunctional transaldolase/phosoglucose isomerase, partial [Caulobacteraceae bacterium]
LGQAVWLDYLHPKFIDDGGLKRLVEEDGLRGVTSNPAIFEAAIGEGDAYAARLARAVEAGDGDMVGLYEGLAIVDIQRAADVLRPVYDRLDGADGFVSLEVSPYLALDTEATIAEARRLWRAVDRPNLMVKVPGTEAGVPAIRSLIGEGINVNVTLLFAIEAYLAVAEAHIAGLEARLAAGGDIARIAGVASFFVSRIDGMIDKTIDKRVAANDPASAALRDLRGKVAIANAKLAYQRYLELIGGPRWRALAAAGARPQRLLWASTGTKDPAYPDILYVDTLIGRDTVNTMPPKTMDAFRDHGHARDTLTEDLDGARGVIARADRLGLDLNGVTRALVDDGVAKFSKAFDDLLGAVAEGRAKALGQKLNGMSASLPETLESAVKETLARAGLEGWSRRLWRKDASLWPGGQADRWLGWLDAADAPAVDFAALEGLQARVKAGSYKHAVLLGMGGSSLGPEVLAMTFGARPGFPRLLICDSTDADQIGRIEAAVDPANTLFIVASKSGTTLEPELLQEHFLDLAARSLGPEAAAKHFVAITDPGSKLEQRAREKGFAAVFAGDPAIGGRYSVLSNFGLVPAGVIGLDVRRIFADLAPMRVACGPGAPPTANPGVRLGVTIGEAAKAGRDKLTILAPAPIADLGAWLEQLTAESTGKTGRGVIPIEGEPILDVGAYGDDRLFVHFRVDDVDAPAIDGLARALEVAGQPVVRITLASTDSIFQEFFRWEVAIAVAGAVIGVDPFDQPDVEAAKVKARSLMSSGGASAGKGWQRFEADGLAFHADPANAEFLEGAAGAHTPEAWLGAHLARAEAHDYVALLAWLDRDPQTIADLGGVRQRIGDRRKAPTALQFGPRFLHSTGQAYKGGPNSGVFLQITAPPERDISLPARETTFGRIEAAQAQGDLEVLAERGRRLLRVHFLSGRAEGLARLARAIDHALA